MRHFSKKTDILFQKVVKQGSFMCAGVEDSVYLGRADEGGGVHCCRCDAV